MSTLRQGLSELSTKCVPWRALQLELEARGLKLQVTVCAQGYHYHPDVWGRTSDGNGCDEGHTAVVNRSTSSTQSSAPLCVHAKWNRTRGAAQSGGPVVNADGDPGAARRRRRRDRARIDNGRTCEGRDRPLANVAAAVTDGARNGSRCLSIRWSDTGGCMPLAAALAALLSWPLEMDADEVAALGLRRRPDDGCTHSLGGSTFENV